MYYIDYIELNSIITKMKLKECDICNKEFSKKEIKRISGEWRCKDCHKKKKKEHREFLKRKVLGIRKRSDMEKEWRKKRKEKLRELKKKTELPKIKGSKQRSYSDKNNIYITTLERQVLFKKYHNLGYDYEESKQKVNKVCNNMKNLIQELKDQKKSDKEINSTFKEEFAKLISQ